MMHAACIVFDFTEFKVETEASAWRRSWSSCGAGGPCVGHRLSGWSGLRKWHENCIPIGVAALRLFFRGFNSISGSDGFLFRRWKMIFWSWGRGKKGKWIKKDKDCQTNYKILAFELLHIVVYWVTNSKTDAVRNMMLFKVDTATAGLPVCWLQYKALNTSPWHPWSLHRRKACFAWKVLGCLWGGLVKKTSGNPWSRIVMKIVKPRKTSQTGIGNEYLTLTSSSKWRLSCTSECRGWNSYGWVVEFKLVATEAWCRSCILKHPKRAVIKDIEVF